MTIDQRLEALTARHEALAQTVEIIASMQRANESKIADLLKLSAQDAENIRALARIAEAPQHRLDEIQGQ